MIRQRDTVGHADFARVEVGMLVADKVAEHEPNNDGENGKDSDDTVLIMAAFSVLQDGGAE